MRNRDRFRQAYAQRRTLRDTARRGGGEARQQLAGVNSHLRELLAKRPSRTYSRADFHQPPAGKQ